MQTVKNPSVEQLILLQYLLGFSKGAIAGKFEVSQEETSTFTVFLSTTIWEAELDPIVNYVFTGDEKQITTDDLTLTITSNEGTDIKALTVELLSEGYSIVLVEKINEEPKYFEVIENIGISGPPNTGT